MTTTTFTVHYSTSALMKGFQRALLSIILFACVVAAAHCGTGCLPVKSPEELSREYEEAIANCSKLAKTKQDAKYCRQDVNRAYGLCDAPWPAITPCDE